MGEVIVLVFTVVVVIFFFMVMLAIDSKLTMIANATERIAASLERSERKDPPPPSPNPPKPEEPVRYTYLDLK